MSIMTVDIAPRQLGDPVYVSQGDIGRIINVRMYDGDDPYIPPAGVTPYIQGLKPSGLGFNVQGTITDNVCTFSTTDEMTDEVGDMVAEVRLIKTGMDIGTANFRYSVEERPRPDGTTDGTIEVVTDVIAEALEAALEDISTAGDNAVARVGTASGVIVQTKAAMTDHSQVYIYIGSETGESTGYWYAYDSTQGDFVPKGEYGGAITDPNLSEAGMAADAEETGSRIKSVRLMFNGIRNLTDLTDTLIFGKYIKTSAIGGTVDLSTETEAQSTRNTLGYTVFDVSEGDTVMFDGRSLVSGDNRVLSFIDSDTGTVLYTTSSESALKTWVVKAPADCKCLINALMRYNWEMIPAHVYLINDDQFSVLQTKVSETDLTVAPLKTSDGWYNLPEENFSLQDWANYNRTNSSRPYRVHYNDPIIFDRDVHIIAKRGFYIAGYWSDGTYIDGRSCIDLPANTPIKLFVRRVSEDTTETANISEFASALLVSSRLTDMVRYRHTFTDVTMFPRVGIIGDSYSAGGGIISGIRALTWGKNMERSSGVVVDIYAKSGESIRQWVTDETNGLPALLAGEECGLYWFAHGINGTSTDEAIGTPEDMETEPRPYTFYGQYVRAIETVQAVFPRARIVVTTVMGTGYVLNQTVYKKANTALVNIAEHCGVPLIDLPDDDFYKSAWYADQHRSNHPTAMLNAGIAHANRRLLAKCILENPSYFADYGDKYNYETSCPVVEGGRVIATPSIADSGDTITLTNIPLPGYHFVRYESDQVTITDGSYTMPNRKVIVTGVFEADQ